MLFRKIANKILTLITIATLMSNVYGQREADRWYFGYNSGLNFNSGEPEVLYDGHTHVPYGAVGTVCDSISNLLFYSTADTVYTYQHTYMENGYDFDYSGSGLQSNLIVQWPESDSLYFVFRVPDLKDGMGLSYNIVDISKNNGLGAVIVRDVILAHAWDASDKVTATLHKNKRDIWVITRKFREDSYAVYLITPEGINDIPSLYPAPDIIGQDGDVGVFKLSYSKKYLFANYGSPMTTEVCRFNSETGVIELLYELSIGLNMYGLEFSPD